MSENHLVLVKEIKYGTSLLGTRFSTMLLDGYEININVDGPIFNDDLRVIKNFGLPKMNSSRRGDLVIKFKVDRDLEFTKEQIKVIMAHFPIDKFNVGDCDTVTAENPDEINDSDDSDDELNNEGSNVQCQQQ